VAIAVAARPPPVANGDRQDHRSRKVSGTSHEGDQTMNDTQLTITGNLVHDPELRFTPGGQPAARFRVASTPRFYDKASGEWKDGESLFLTCQAWRQMAENAAGSLQQGTRVIVTGRLRQRSYEAKDGGQRTVYELEADEVGVSLRSAAVKVRKAARPGNGGQAGQQASSGAADPQASEPVGGYSDEPPF
jgi:single-strand DNA-binding protein